MSTFKVGMTRENAANPALYDKIDSLDGNKSGKLSKVDIQLFKQRILGQHSSNEKTIFALGSTIAEKLMGYTDNIDQQFVTNFIKEYVNEDNIEAFLNGYDSNNWMYAVVFADGDGIFEQLRREYNYDAKNEVIKDLAVKLMKYLNHIGQANDAKQIEQIIDNLTFSESDIKILDNIVNELNEKHAVINQEKKGKLGSTDDILGTRGKYFDYTM